MYIETGETPAQDSNSNKAPLLGSRVVDGLLTAMPQAAAGNLLLAGEINGNFYIACRTHEPDSKNPLATLTPREYESLLLLANGHGYTGIAQDLDLSFYTVRSHVRNLFEKFRISSGSEAASYIPLNVKTILPKIGDYTSIDRALNSLTEPEQIIFQGIAKGLANSQIAYGQKRNESTVRTHRKTMVRKLGIPEGRDHNGIHLRRYIGAISNLMLLRETQTLPATE